MKLSNFLNIFGFQDSEKRFTLPKGYYLSKEYKDFDIENFFNDWTIGESHGDQTQNMNNINCYFQHFTEIPNTLKSAIRVENNELKLGVRYEPATVDNIPLDFKAGKIESKRKFKYGVIQVTAKLPNNKYLWPAIWFCGTQSWPPEIDLMEAYNNGHIQYASSNHIACEPNIHYIENGKHKAIFPGNKYVERPDERYITYTLHWEKEFIRFYYDDYLVFECNDKKILDQMNQPMSLILNNAVEFGVKLNNKDINKLRTGNNWFYIKNIKYFDKKRIDNIKNLQK